MSPEKLMNKLMRLLEGNNKKLKRDRISDLLKKLRKQERSAKVKLTKEKNRTRRKRLSTRIKILHTERKKALRRFKELKKKR